MVSVHTGMAWSYIYIEFHKRKGAGVRRIWKKAGPRVFCFVLFGFYFFILVFALRKCQTRPRINKGLALQW